MAIAQTAYDLLDWLFGYEETVELDTPAILVGDTFVSGAIEIEVVAIETECPYFVIPAEWEAWGTEGKWAYVEGRDTSIPAHVAMSRSRAEWMPYDYLVMCALEA